MATATGPSDPLERLEVKEVKILDIISPSKYVITNGQLLNNDALTELELELGETMKVTDPGRDDGTTLTLSTYIIVRESSTAPCHRGHVTSVVDHIAEVFLCDHGTSITVDSKNKNLWAPLPDYLLHVLAFRTVIATIPGLVPAHCLNLKNGPKLMTQQMTIEPFWYFSPATNWKSNALSIAKEWVTSAEILGMITLERKSRLAIYADFYKDSDSKCPLSYFLQMNNVAMVDSDTFIKLVVQPNP